MNIESFLKKICFVDKKVDQITFDSGKEVAKISIKEIHLIRNKKHIWNFNNAKYMKDVYLVFLGVKNFTTEPLAVVPNGNLNNWEIEKIKGNTYKVSLFIDGHKIGGKNVELIVSFISSCLYIEDPRKPKKRIFL